MLKKSNPFAAVLCACLLALTALAAGQAPSALPGPQREAVDRVVNQVLSSSGVPSASIAVVKDGRVAYLQAYGSARLDPAVPARTSMRYGIGSVSKQFTSSAILMLAEQGKLSLDDPVSRFFPTLSRASDVTIRELLSHTSGYRDYWPQDYVPPFMLQPITVPRILELWAHQPLDFEPGTQWQYSNTGYVIAGAIVEKASGMPLFDFLRKNIFTPLEMTSIVNTDQQALADDDPAGYLRYAFGPPRPAPKEGKGWLFAAGELSMSAEDLARWDISILDRKLLKPASYQAMQTDVLLKNGQGTAYGLGVMIRDEGGHHALEHGGEVSGFCSQNIVLPEDRAAIVVLVNQDSNDAPQQIARKLVPVLFPATDARASEVLDRARAVLDGLREGKLDRSLLTGKANSYFTRQAIDDFASSLSALGPVSDFRQAAQQERGGMTFRLFTVKFASKSVDIWYREMPDGKIEQFQVAPH